MNNTNLDLSTILPITSFDVTFGLTGVTINYTIKMYNDLITIVKSEFDNIDNSLLQSNQSIDLDDVRWAFIMLRQMVVSVKEIAEVEELLKFLTQHKGLLINIHSTLCSFIELIDSSRTENKLDPVKSKFTGILNMVPSNNRSYQPSMFPSGCNSDGIKLIRFLIGLTQTY